MPTTKTVRLQCSNPDCRHWFSEEIECPELRLGWDQERTRPDDYKEVECPDCRTTMHINVTQKCLETKRGVGPDGQVIFSAVDKIYLDMAQNRLKDPLKPLDEAAKQLITANSFFMVAYSFLVGGADKGFFSKDIPGSLLTPLFFAILSVIFATGVFMPIMVKLNITDPDPIKRYYNRRLWVKYCALAVSLCLFFGAGIALLRVLAG